MNMLRAIFASLLLAISLNSFAFTPTTGFYQQYTSDNTGFRGGTGIALEIQNQYMFAAGFVFDASGMPTYVTMQGQLQLGNNGEGAFWYYNSDNDAGNGLATYSNGQCIGNDTNCPYKKPSASIAGKFEIGFFSENLALLHWSTSNGDATALLGRFNFNTGGEEPLSLLGEWDVLTSTPVATVAGDPLRYGGDKWLIKNVATSPISGIAKTILGCVPASEGLPACGPQTLTGTATAVPVPPNTFYKYALAITDPARIGANNIVRVYHFSSDETGTGLPVTQAFTHTIKGTVNFCHSGVATPEACTGSSTKFVAYRSASAEYAVSGTGMD